MKLILTLCALALCSVLTVRAEDTPTTPPKGKGKGSPEAMFKRLDTNNDGFLSKEEYLAGPAGKRDAAKAEKAYAAMDKTGDGKVTLEEFKAFIAAHHKKAPTDAPATTTPSTPTTPATPAAPK